MEYIKCDNEVCNFIEYMDHVDPEIWLNKPCPKCGENLLTEEDHAAFQEYEKLQEMLNSLPPEKLKQLESLGKVFLKQRGIQIPEDPDALVKMDVNFHKGLNLKIDDQDVN